MQDLTESAVRDALRHVLDPELGINIVDLGLVYGIEIGGATVRVRMTMTTPACPLGAYLSDLAESEIKAHLAGVDVWTCERCGHEQRGSFQPDPRLLHEG